jgi:hypothetical protein
VTTLGATRGSGRRERSAPRRRAETGRCGASAAESAATSAGTSMVRSTCWRCWSSAADLWRWWRGWELGGWLGLSQTDFAAGTRRWGGEGSAAAVGEAWAVGGSGSGSGGCGAAWPGALWLAKKKTNWAMDYAPPPTQYGGVVFLLRSSNVDSHLQPPGSPIGDRVLLCR